MPRTNAPSEKRNGGNTTTVSRPPRPSVPAPPKGKK